MGSLQVQPRPLYGIGTVARLTGIKPDTLRIWERRYQLGASHKSASGRRQYTQADLEHLQLVAALVARGARIGEIATSERRTLEMMLRARSGLEANELTEKKPRVLFVGEQLFAWLEEHQGCLVNVDAKLLPGSLEVLDADVDADVGEIDALVIECGDLGGEKLAMMQRIADRLATDNVLALSGADSNRWQPVLKEQGVTLGAFPPDPAFLSVYLKLALQERATSAGSSNLGELVMGKPRLLSAEEVESARGLEQSRMGYRPAKMRELVLDLAALEDRVSASDSAGWEDVSVQACVYAYAGQARWLMEKALGLVLEAERKSP
jgi:DNA-binding transcriptional MerR regulator